MIHKALVIILLCVYTPLLHSQTCCSGGIPLSNNIGLEILDKGTLQVNLSYDYNNLNTLNNGKDELDDSARLRTTNSILLNLSYSITNNFAVEGLFTWVNQRREINQFGNQNIDQVSGVGDGVLLAKYNFKNVLGDKSFVRVGVGTKMPIGSTTKTNENGILLNADMQPGSGAWDLIYWLQLSKSFDFRQSLNFSIRTIYRVTGENDSYLSFTTYGFGNEFLTYFSFTDQIDLFNTIATPSISFKYRHAEQDEIGGFNLDNTGGEWVFIAPALSVNINSNLAISAKAELPIYSYVDGTQLTQTFRITTGLLYKVPLRNKKNKFNILENEI